MKRLSVFTILFSLFITFSALAQKPAVVISDEPGWHKIGEINASLEMETESIVVLGSDEFASIKLKVTDAPLNVERVQVHYESGEVEDIDVRSSLQAGSETDVLKLKNGEREIEKVSFTYQTSPNYDGKKAHIELYGYKTEDASDAYLKNDNRDNDNSDDAERAIDRAEDDVDHAADRTGNDLERAADETEREIKDEKSDAKKNADRTGEKVEDGFNRSTAVIGAEIKDKTFEGKMGPNGETIYINENSDYYYIDKDGNRASITKLEMRDKPEKDNK